MSNDYEVDPEDYAPLPGTEERADYEMIAIGAEARQFLDSKLGTFVVNSAEEKVIDAQKKLGRVDPRDHEKIAELQTVIRQFDHFEQCLQELMTAGDSAYQAYLLRHHGSQE